MKKLKGLEDTLLTMADDDKTPMPIFKVILRRIGNTKARTADEARYISKIISKLRGKELELEFSDEEFKTIKDAFERNEMDLAAFVQGQVLGRLDTAGGE